MSGMISNLDCSFIFIVFSHLDDLVNGLFLCLDYKPIFFSGDLSKIS
jgi:hypothetical protein